MVLLLVVLNEKVEVRCPTASSEAEFARSNNGGAKDWCYRPLRQAGEEAVKNRSMSLRQSLTLLVIYLLLPALGLHMPDLVTIEALLLLVKVRLKLSLVLVVLVLTPLALEHGDVHRVDLVLVAGTGNSRYLSSHVEKVESSRVESEVVSDRGVLDSSLKHGLADVACDGLATPFLVLPDVAPELFKPISEL